MKRFLPTLCLLLFGFCVQIKAQTFRVINKEDQTPVVFATIQTGSQQGTISNEEGYFNVNLEEQTNFLISSMGFNSLEISADQLRALDGGIVLLEPQAIMLNEVLLRDKELTVEQILARTKAAIPENYLQKTGDYQVFFRSSDQMDFDNLEMEVEKVSFLSKQEQQALENESRDLTDQILKSKARSFLDFSGNYQRNSEGEDYFKLGRATVLTDTRQNVSLDRVQQRAQNLMLKFLDTTKTYKVKTGIFKIEDSLALGDEMLSEQEQDMYSPSYFRTSTASLIKLSNWGENSLMRFLSIEDYKHELKNITYFNGQTVYAITFRPRRARAKYSGNLFISASDFAVLKADYTYAQGKRGQKVNLKLVLGVKYIENLSSGTVLYHQNETGKYVPYYIQRDHGQYIYLHRGLKLIENSSKRHKIRLDFLLEGANRNREELLITAYQPLGDQVWPEESDKKIRVERLQQFEAGIWQDQQIIAPLEEMKNFKATD